MSNIKYASREIRIGINKNQKVECFKYLEEWITNNTNEL